jgi:hypothetical protein
MSRRIAIMLADRRGWIVGRMQQPGDRAAAEAKRKRKLRPHHRFHDR